MAVKVLAENWADRIDVRERFLAEARILRRADSDRVVAVYDIGELTDGRPYFVMTYADRGSLADRLAGGALDVAEALRYGAEAATGIAVLHDTGVIHRDLTPANVLLRTGRGGVEQVLVADLGLAKAAAHGSGITQPVGTPGYMAPEQADPRHGIDLRVDVYSLGALVYHLLTGQPPALPSAVPEPVPPSALRPEVPPAGDAVVVRALAYDPDARYSTALKLAEALTALTRPTEAAKGVVTEAANEAAVEAAKEVVTEAANGAANEAAESEPPDTVQFAAVPVEQPADADSGDGDGNADAVPAPASEGSGDGRSRLRSWVVAVLGAVVLLGLVGAGVWVQRMRPDSVRVADSTGSLRIAVPAGWAGQMQDGGWDLAPFGLAHHEGTGLAVASDLARWRAPDSSTPGVFVGLGHGLDPSQLVAHSVGRECAHETSAPYRRGSLSGQLYRYGSCPGTSLELVEAVLRTGQPEDVLYVQVRQEPGGTEASDVLASLALGPLP